MSRIDKRFVELREQTRTFGKSRINRPYRLQSIKQVGSLARGVRPSGCGKPLVDANSHRSTGKPAAGEAEQRQQRGSRAVRDLRQHGRRAAGVRRALNRNHLLVDAR